MQFNIHQYSAECIHLLHVRLALEYLCNVCIFQELTSWRLIVVSKHHYFYTVQYASLVYRVMAIVSVHPPHSLAVSKIIRTCHHLVTPSPIIVISFSQTLWCSTSELGTLDLGRGMKNLQFLTYYTCIWLQIGSDTWYDCVIIDEFWRSCLLLKTMLEPISLRIQHQSQLPHVAQLLFPLVCQSKGQFKVIHGHVSSLFIQKW